MGRGSQTDAFGGDDLLYGKLPRRSTDHAFEHVFTLICRRVSGDTGVFSDLSLLDVEGERASTIEEHRRRISRNRDALHQMHTRGLVELVEGPAYECFRLTEEGRSRRASSKTG